MKMIDLILQYKAYQDNKKEAYDAIGQYKLYTDREVTAMLEEVSNAESVLRSNGLMFCKELSELLGTTVNNSNHVLKALERITGI